MLLRNNTIDLFEIYFQDEEPDHMPEILNLKTIALFKERACRGPTSKPPEGKDHQRSCPGLCEINAASSLQLVKEVLFLFVIYATQDSSTVLPDDLVPVVQTRIE